MRGSHGRTHEPALDAAYLATLDVGGLDEAATDPVARLKNPGRDYTTATIFQVVLPPADDPAQLPRYRAVDVFVDQGSRHFQDAPGRPALVKRLVAYFDSWRVTHVVADRSGVGEGITDWLIAAMGHDRVTGYSFSGRGKARLGSRFLSLIETGRFHYWSGDQDRPLSDGWWFWQQVSACTYYVPPDGQFERDLRWSVPESAKVSTPAGRLPIHDDRLVSAALVAEADRLIREGKIAFGRAESAIVAPTDPLGDLSF